MRIRQFRLYPVCIPLNVRFSQANSDSNSSRSMVLEVETTFGHQGYGECCPRRYVTGEDLRTVSQEIWAVESQLAQISFGDLQAITDALDSLSIGPATRCVLELALMDAWGKTCQASLYSSFCRYERESITYAGILPMQNPKAIPSLIGKLQQLGFPEIKLKVGRDLAHTFALVKAVKAAYPEGIPLRLDVNEAWDLKTACEYVPALAEAGVSLFEQPLPRGQEADMPALMEACGQSVVFMADESVTTFASAKAAIEGKWFHRFNLKLSKHGGLVASQRIYELAQAAGIKCQLGAHFGETAILTAAGLIFHGMVPELTACEGGLGAILLQEDLSAQPLQLGRGASIPHPAQRLAGPGLGLDIHKEVLTRYSQQPV